MSILYLSPVGGEMHLHELEGCVRDRVAFLRALAARGDLFYSQYLLEGSPYDNAGHFALHLVAGLAGNSPFAQLVRTGELLLLQRRLSYMKPLSLRQFARKVLNYITKLRLTEPYVDCIRKVCSNLQVAHVAQHLLKSVHSEDCTRHSIKVPFSRCLPLVASRKVEITNGEATVPCGLWLKYLILLYKEHLSCRDKLKEDLQVLREDERIMRIVTQYSNYRIDEEHVPKGADKVLLSQDVDRASDFFPPCMRNLHRRFRKHHRLSHDQRFYYTCFLKDIGMPVNEAIEFWKEEYQHPSCTSACQHSWAKDSAKFIQGLRHTYGLEGARKSYSCVGCAKLQGSSGARAEGGCPFKDFSEVNMASVLHPDFVKNSELMSKVTLYKSVHNYSKACSFYLGTMFPKAENSVRMAPVKFYKKAYHSSL